MFAKFVLICTVINLSIASQSIFGFTFNSMDPVVTATPVAAAAPAPAVIAASDKTKIATSAITPPTSDPTGSQKYTVLKNTTLRVKEPTEALKECEYIRDWEASYVFKSEKHEMVIYIVQQCLDENFAIIKQAVSFKYNDEDSPTLLPEGCPVPMIDDRKENPCENGMALGHQLYKDVAQIITREIYHNPATLSGIDKTTPIDNANGLASLMKTMPRLENLINEVVKDSMYTTSKTTQPKKYTNMGARETTEKFYYPDGSWGYMYRNSDGRVIRTEIIKPDQSYVIVKIILNPKNHMRKESYSAEGVLISSQDVKYVQSPHIPAYVHKPTDGNPLVDVNVKIINEDRSETVRKADNKVVTTYSFGLKIIEFKDGSYKLKHHNTDIADSIIPAREPHPNGTATEVVNSDGSKTILVSITEPKVYEYISTKYQDGIEIRYFKYGVETHLPDGTIIWIGDYGEGNIFHPDESTTWVSRLPHRLPLQKGDSVYHWMDGSTSKFVDENTLKTEYPSGLTVVRTNDGTCTTTGPADANGKTVVVVSNSFEPPRDQFAAEEVTTRDAEGKQIGEVIVRPNPFNRWIAPIEFHFSSDIKKELNKAADNFGEILEKYVNTNVSCFLEKVYTLQENYLTFVCAESQAKSIRELLKKEFKNDLVCKQIDCEKINDKLMDDMLAASNAGVTKEEMAKISVKSANYQGTFTSN